MVGKWQLWARKKATFGGELGGELTGEPRGSRRELGEESNSWQEEERDSVLPFTGSNLVMIIKNSQPDNLYVCKR